MTEQNKSGAGAALAEDSASRGRKAPLNRPMILSHGTLECRNLVKSRKFYEEFLGLEVVRHSERSMKIRLGEYFCVVCLERGERAHPTVMGNHWGVDLSSKEEVERAHQLAHELAETYGISKITKLIDNETYGFYFVDLDGNWWEMQYSGDGQFDGTGRNDQHFKDGDVVPM